MPITLITGTPGAGKSLYAVKMLLEEIIPTGRPVFTNINGFTTDAKNVTVVGVDAPKEWMTYPDGSFCVFDEIQTAYPFKNGMAQTPDYIRKYETHRHRGMDFVFITQGPYLLDRHLHPLIDRHIHVYRPFGFKRSTILEWNGVNEKPQPLQSRTNAAVKNFRFPKKYFEHYKSAVVHTVKARFPWKLAALALGLVALLGYAAYGGYQFLTSDMLAGRRSEELDAGRAADAAADPSVCAAVASVAGRTVRLRVGPQLYAIPRNRLVIRDGLVTVADAEGLAWPLCRVTG